MASQEIDNLLQIQDDREFLQRAYLRILGRPCDLYGMVTHLEALGNHVPRRTVIQAIADSDEAQGRLSAARSSGTPRRPLFARFYGRLTRALGNLVRRIILVRFDSIDHKLMFLTQELASQSETVCQKNDDALWALSEKLDANFSAVRLEQESLRARLDAVTRTLEEVEERLISEASRRLESAFDLQRRYLDHVAERVQAQIIQHHAAASDAVLSTLGQRQERLDRGLSEQIAAVARSVHPPVFMGDGDLLVTQVEGFIVGLPKEEWRIASHFAFRGVLEPGLTKLFKEIVKPGMVVVDVGANVGIYTLLGARLLAGQGKVHSFEPTPRTAAILRQNIQVNGFLESGIIDVHASAVTDRRGLGRLTLFAEDFGHNTLYWHTGEADSLTVPTISLDEALPSEDHVDFVKIDAEGAEAGIVRGMRETILRNPSIRIVLEFAPAHLRRADVDPAGFLSELRTLGFQVTRVNDLTGELEPAPEEELINAFSANLHLTRVNLSGGAIS